MGEKERKPFQLTFNGLLKVDFHGSRVTSDGGLILVRELDERLGLGTLIDEHLSDSREGLNKKFPLADLLRQSVYSRLAGYEDLNDAARVSADPTFRLIGSEKNWNRGPALTSTLHGFETGTLTSEDNLLGLMALNRELVGPSRSRRRIRAASYWTWIRPKAPSMGNRKGALTTAISSRSATTRCCCSTSTATVWRRSCAQGMSTGAEDWDELLLPEIERQQAEGKQVAFRGDAAFAKPEVYEASEERGVQYAIRIPANKSLELEIGRHLVSAAGKACVLTWNGSADGLPCPVARKSCARSRGPARSRRPISSDFSVQARIALRMRFGAAPAGRHLQPPADRFRHVRALRDGRARP